ncbi:MAG: YlbF family regulator [Erysipelotrichaceae bacterium]|nr:YlbF family regulator [Erysipelotrichaceae bacterium]
MKKLNKDIENKAKKLNQWLLDNELVKEYQHYETLIQQHPELQKQEEELKQLQQQIVQMKHSDEDASQIIETYEIKKQQFDENPIIHNYLSLKEELNDLMIQIETIINEQLQKDVDE